VQKNSLTFLDRVVDKNFIGYQINELESYTIDSLVK